MAYDRAAMNTTTPTPQKPLNERLAAIDLTAFAEKSGIPRRTLERIRADAEYQPSTTTRLALDAALKRYESRTQKA